MAQRERVVKISDKTFEDLRREQAIILEKMGYPPRLKEVLERRYWLGKEAELIRRKCKGKGWDLGGI